MKTGGLRTKGIVKTSSIIKPLITIVTVVYNDSENIEETIRSVIDQTYDSIEYIIIDGASTDNTIEIIKKYEDKIDYWQSEPDDGIYDAMNKGIKLANGDWINFMNSGDCFVGNTIINDCFFNKNYIGIDVVYGDSIEENDNHEQKKEVKRNLNQLYLGPIFRHNAAFFRLSIHKNNLFKIERKDLGYALDFKFIYDLYNQNKKFYHLHIFIVKYDKEGISNNMKLNNLYVYRIVKEYKPFIALLIYIIRLLRIFMKTKISPYIIRFYHK